MLGGDVSNAVNQGAVLQHVETTKLPSDYPVLESRSHTRFLAELIIRGGLNKSWKTKTEGRESWINRVSKCRVCHLLLGGGDNA